MKKFLKFILISMIVLCSTFNLPINHNNNYTDSKTNGGLTLKCATSHTPIYIEGNSQFIGANGIALGDGTENNPYIIENWEIDATNDNGIYIKNTDAYFVIRDNIIRNGTVGLKYGIILMNASNGMVENNDLWNTSLGIYLNSANDVIIKNNTTKMNGQFGIYVWESNRTTIQNNMATSNTKSGIFLGRSFDSVIMNNTSKTNTEQGIFLSTVNNCLLINNKAYGNQHGLYLSTTSINNTICRNIFYDNSIAQTGASLDSIDNIWYFNSTGNFYGDYEEKYPWASNNGRIWNTPYEVDNYNRIDPYPLVKWPPTPQSPILQVISFSSNGNTTLIWNALDEAISYNIYRSNKPIVNLNELNPIQIVYAVNYTDTVEENGQYFYVITASDGYMESEISNCEMITVEISSWTKIIMDLFPTISLAVNIILILIVIIQLKKRR